jgi:hypothetical protein
VERSSLSTASRPSRPEEFHLEIVSTSNLLAREWSKSKSRPPQGELPRMR